MLRLPCLPWDLAEAKPREGKAGEGRTVSSLVTGESCARCREVDEASVGREFMGVKIGVRYS